MSDVRGQRREIRKETVGTLGGALPYLPRWGARRGYLPRWGWNAASLACEADLSPREQGQGAGASLGHSFPLPDSGQLFVPAAFGWGLSPQDQEGDAIGQHARQQGAAHHVQV